MQDAAYAEDDTAESKQNWHLWDRQRLFTLGPWDSEQQPVLHAIYPKEVSKLDSEAGESVCLTAVLHWIYK